MTDRKMTDRKVTRKSSRIGYYQSCFSIKYLAKVSLLRHKPMAKFRTGETIINILLSPLKDGHKFYV